MQRKLFRLQLDNTYFYTHTETMRFSFDHAKRASNLKKHGLDLADAQQVIESGQTVTFEDRRFDYGEERFVTLGPLGDMLVVIVMLVPLLSKLKIVEVGFQVRLL